jgi:3-(3-hydroxy-phenyl)propionate hydroxylase
VLFVADATLSSRLALSQAGIEILTDIDAEAIGDWLREQGIVAALVRPDRYIRGTARNESELARLVAVLEPSTQVPSAA